jgi:dTDP-4-dehydrorhamnose 3,5-epimerase
MRFTKTPIPQLFIVDEEKRSDSRGFFARIWCQNELSDQGLTNQCAQASLSHNNRRGTLRGMHFQIPPHSEAKLVRVVHGAIHDVVLDLRDGSPSWGRWFATELSGENRRALFVPPGCAHGYLTLVDDTELLYLMSTAYQATAYCGLHWNADALSGAWPFQPLVISSQDDGWPMQLVRLASDQFAIPDRAAG